MGKYTKYIFLIFVLLWEFTAFGQVDKNQIEKLWISIAFDDTGSSFNNGFHEHYTKLLKFENGQLVVMHFGLGDDLPVPFFIDQEDHLISDKFENTKIVKLTEDSLIIDFENIYRYTFIPFPSAKTLNSVEPLKELLPLNSWTIQKNTWDELITIEFLDYNADQSSTRFGYDVQSLEHFQSDNIIFNHTNGLWTTKTINETTVLNYQFIIEPFFNTTLLVKHISRDSISGSTWYQGEEFEMTLFPETNLSTAQKTQLEAFLTSGKWKLESYHVPRQLFAMREVFSDGNAVDRALRIDSLDFVNKRISYKFHADHTYEKYKGSRAAFQGGWQLSRSGKILKLEEQELAEELRPVFEKYVKIDHLREGELEILSMEELYVNEFQTHNYFIRQTYILE